MTHPENAFYIDLKPISDFATLADPNVYAPLPNDWWIGTSDIIGSTQAVAQGRYKTVNMVGAAVISAQINAHEGASFPFIFGGDGAGFAVPPAWKDNAATALAAVQVWAREEFDMGLRVGMVRVSDIRAAGFDVTLARFQVSDGVDYAMFAGGGLSWAENQMKSGAFGVPEAEKGTQPDLTGLSCRWSHMPSRNGTILSLVIAPTEDAPGPAFAKLAHEVTMIAADLDRAGTPSPAQGPGSDWPPPGAVLEAHASRGAGSVAKRRRQVLFETFIAWVLIKTGLKIGGFDARTYQRVVGGNADFRKFEDGLKMTLDCDPAHEARLIEVLDRGVTDGVIRYGVHRQDEAMMTCIVPSIMRDDHVHFVDGAAGGYTAAASHLKA
ncbi:MAG: DUF3095 domain-containing protein [Aliishimia sp.]